LEPIIHPTGVSKTARFLRFKAHEATAYNLHVLQTHATEITSRSIDQDSFTRNGRLATVGFFFFWLCILTKMTRFPHV
jgi:hypothetical protein